MAKRNVFSILVISLVAVLVFSFQNCAPGFQAASLNSEGLTELSAGSGVPIGMYDDAGKAVVDGDPVIVNIEYRARITHTRIPDDAIVTWAASAAPGGGVVHLHPGANKNETAFHCESAGELYLSVKVEANGVTYKSTDLTYTCLASAPVATPTPTPAPSAPTVVTFRIPAGTDRGAWNTAATVVNVKVGQTLRIINDDVVAHRLHTGGAPCGHQNADSAPGGTYDCVISRPVDSANGSTYDHNFGTAARFHVNATN